MTKSVRSAQMSPLRYVVPLFGIVLSTVVLGERQSSWSLAGMVLVLVLVSMVGFFLRSPVPFLQHGRE